MKKRWIVNLTADERVALEQLVLRRSPELTRPSSPEVVHVATLE
jgi:hypothetical protein